MRLPMKCMKSRVCNFSTAGLATALLGVVLALYGFPKIIKYQISQGVALKEGSEGFKLWKDMPIPLEFKVYLYNVTNPKEVTEGVKPIVKEIGPYVYEETRTKDHIRFTENDTVSYYLKKTFKFNREASKPLLDTDELTLLNVALLGMVIKVNKIMPAVLSTVDQVIPYLFDSPKDPFVRTSVSNFLFDGVFISCNASENSMVGLVCDSMKSRLPPTIRESEESGEGFYFSMFNHINDTLDGPYSIRRGIIEPQRLGEIVSYKNETTLEEWEEPCDELKGTDTTIFAPIEEGKEPKRIYIFQPDVCRVMYAELASKNMSFGLQSYRYEATKMVLAANKTNPENGCFCETNWSMLRDGCSLDGVQNLEPCQEAPVIASFPHFYLADPIFRQYVEDDVEPDKEKHGTYVEIEPRTGTALKGAKRMQFNMEVQKFRSIKILSNVSPGLFPVLWIEEGAQIDTKIKALLDGVHGKIMITKILQWIIMAIGVILILVAFHFRRKDIVDKWSWTPNRVDMDMPSYKTDTIRPGAAQKDGRINAFDNPVFKNNESVPHK